MGRPHLTRAARARLGCGVGGLMAAVGVWLVAGVGWALMVAGLVIAAVALLLYDVDEPEQQSIKPRRFVR